MTATLIPILLRTSQHRLDDIGQNKPIPFWSKLPAVPTYPFVCGATRRRSPHRSQGRSESEGGSKSGKAPVNAARVCSCEINVAFNYCVVTNASMESGSIGHLNDGSSETMMGCNRTNNITLSSPTTALKATTSTSRSRFDCFLEIKRANPKEQPDSDTK